MKKADYFKAIKEITTEMRANGFSYARIYSEPRKKTGYRTKVYLPFNAKTLPYFINEFFDATVVAKYVPGREVVTPSQYKHYIDAHVVITPVDNVIG